MPTKFSFKIMGKIFFSMENIIIVASKVQGNVIETYSSSTFEKSDSMITDNCCVRKNKKLFR